jgi:hypothetical protein
MLPGPEIATRLTPVESDAIEIHGSPESAEFPGSVLMSIHVHVPALFVPDHIEPPPTQATTFDPVESDAIEYQTFPFREEFPGVVLRSIQVHVPALFVPDHIEPPPAQATVFEPVESDAIDFHDSPESAEFPDVVLRSVHIHVPPPLFVPDHIEPFIEQAITFDPVESYAIEFQLCPVREGFAVVLRSVHIHIKPVLYPDHREQDDYFGQQTEEKGEHDVALNERQEDDEAVEI